jgi:hypothetical protein
MIQNSVWKFQKQNGEDSKPNYEDSKQSCDDSKQNREDSNSMVRLKR